MTTHAHLPFRQRLHFSGVGGTAMAAGARLALEMGCEARGSDNPLYPPASWMVEELGIPVNQHYAAENLHWQPDAVIIGNALSRGNPEVEAALDRRIPYLSLPEWLKEHILRFRRPVAICGTHGKTTTTALTAYLLERAGHETGYLIGGQPMDFPRSSRLGAVDAPFVIEGDEYDTAFFDKRAKFFHYIPEIALVTSIEFDHGDIYRDLADIERAFRLMLRQVPSGGQVVLCADDPGAMALAPHAFSPVITYGFSMEANWRGEIIRRGSNPALRIYRDGVLWGECKAPLAGRHNLQNAIGAIAVSGALGVTPAQVEESLPRFKGVRRRMEVFLEHEDALFVDDFAHHPTAIRGVIEAARDRWPGRRLWVAFEPRSNTTVTNRFQTELERALSGGDHIWIGPIHRGANIPPEERLDREGLVSALRERGREAYATDDVGEIATHISEHVGPGDVVLILSNGAFGGLDAMLRERFGA
ncbi:MAG: UDP-N-acetylmuramate--L-alanine ligase [Candidatus Hydrogenedentota bacterium]